MSDLAPTPETLAPITDDAAMRHSKVPPKLVEDCLEDPDALRPVARAMAAVNLHNTFIKVSHPNASLKDKLEFQAMVNKIGRIDTKDVAENAKAGFHFTINFSGANEKLVIDAPANVVEHEEC